MRLSIGLLLVVCVCKVTAQEDATTTLQNTTMSLLQNALPQNALPQNDTMKKSAASSREKRSDIPFAGQTLQATYSVLSHPIVAAALQKISMDAMATVASALNEVHRTEVSSKRSEIMARTLDKMARLQAPYRQAMPMLHDGSGSGEEDDLSGSGDIDNRSPESIRPNIIEEDAPNNKRSKIKHHHHHHHHHKHHHHSDKRSKKGKHAKSDNLVTSIDETNLDEHSATERALKHINWDLLANNTDVAEKIALDSHIPVKDLLQVLHSGASRSEITKQAAAMINQSIDTQSDLAKLYSAEEKTPEEERAEEQKKLMQQANQALSSENLNSTTLVSNGASSHLKNNTNSTAWKIPNNVPEACIGLVKQYSNGELTLKDYLKQLKQCKKEAQLQEQMSHTTPLQREAVATQNLIQKQAYIYALNSMRNYRPTTKEAQTADAIMDKWRSNSGFSKSQTQTAAPNPAQIPDAVKQFMTQQQPSVQTLAAAPAATLTQQQPAAQQTATSTAAQQTATSTAAQQTATASTATTAAQQTATAVVQPQPASSEVATANSAVPATVDSTQTVPATVDLPSLQITSDSTNRQPATVEASRQPSAQTPAVVTTTEQQPAAQTPAPQFRIESTVTQIPDPQGTVVSLPSSDATASQAVQTMSQSAPTKPGDVIVQAHARSPLKHVLTGKQHKNLLLSKKASLLSPFATSVNSLFASSVDGESAKRSNILQQKMQLLNGNIEQQLEQQFQPQAAVADKFSLAASEVQQPAASFLSEFSPVFPVVPSNDAVTKKSQIPQQPQTNIAQQNPSQQFLKSDIPEQQQQQFLATKSNIPQQQSATKSNIPQQSTSKQQPMNNLLITGGELAKERFFASLANPALHDIPVDTNLVAALQSITNKQGVIETSEATKGGLYKRDLLTSKSYNQKRDNDKIYGKRESGDVIKQVKSAKAIERSKMALPLLSNQQGPKLMDKIRDIGRIIATP